MEYQLDTVEVRRKVFKDREYADVVWMVFLGKDPEREPRNVLEWYCS